MILLMGGKNEPVFLSQTAQWIAPDLADVQTKQDGLPGLCCRERQGPRAVHGTPRQDDLLTRFERDGRAAPSGWLSPFDGFVPDFLQLDAGLM